MPVLGPEDTIVALATALGEGAIGIVRLSGPGAIEIVDQVFLSKERSPLSNLKTYRCRYGWIVRDKNDIEKQGLSFRDFKKSVIDEVIVTLMRAPKSYTREDVVEISSHGGTHAHREILEILLEKGARLAHPGEFTKRAFLNGRLDLTQAEAVLDVIRAKSDLALRSGLSQLSGEISRCVAHLKSELLGITADMEAQIDFPDEEAASQDPLGLKNRIFEFRRQLDILLQRSFKGRIIREGLRVVIYGKPNVGKSSLLNAILKKERAIVTPIAGTTRDTIEEPIVVNGLAVRLIDTAGIFQHRDEIEKEAQGRTRKALEDCDLVLFVVDGSLPLTQEDRALASRVSSKKVVTVINKCDQPQKAGREELQDFFHGSVLEVSALTGKNIDTLEDLMAESVLGEAPGLSDDVTVTNVRHIEILNRACRFLEGAEKSLEEGLSLEFAALDLRKALEALGEMTGEVFCEDLLDVIFAKFCIGK